MSSVPKRLSAIVAPSISQRSNIWLKTRKGSTAFPRVALWINGD
jgi:hypothetical protein